MNETATQKPLNTFLKIGTIEGWSYLILIFIAMPLKYYANLPQYVKIVGYVHGILFIGFIIVLLYVSNFYKWKSKTVILSFLLSLIPFGTFLLKKTVTHVNK